MTEQQFDQRLQEIDAGHNRRREGADAWRDQEVARLFNECEWGQEKIGRHVGKSHSWVSRRLTFGAFLSFVPTGTKTESLTERRFRDLYRGTRGTEKERFAHVIAKLQDTLPMGHKHQIKKPGFRPALIEIMNDGQWYTSSQLQASLSETFPDIDLEATINAIRGVTTRPPAGKTMQVKKIGKRCQYKLTGSVVQARSVPPEAVAHLVEGVGPILDELKRWGRAHEYQMSPVAIRLIAAKLEKLLEPLMERVHS